MSETVCECMSQTAILATKIILSGETGNSILESVRLDIIRSLVIAIPDAETEQLFELIYFLVSSDVEIPSKGPSKKT